MERRALRVRQDMISGDFFRTSEAFWGYFTDPFIILTFSVEILAC